MWDREEVSVDGNSPNTANEKFMEMRGLIEQRTSFNLLVLLYSCPNPQQDLCSAASFIYNQNKMRRTQLGHSQDMSSFEVITFQCCVKKCVRDRKRVSLAEVKILHCQ